jgi:pimeloyl-ACP methyl ester carboxylesterase
MKSKVAKLVVRYVVVPVVSVLAIGICSLAVYRAVLQHKVEGETKIRTPNGIDSLEPVVLGGVRQWILIRGTDKSNPVLLFLHGGPGSADIMFARHFDGDLVQSFVVVHWDQRGAGKSYSSRIPVETMNRDQFVSDVRELSKYLSERFGARKILLVGHSWGSEIGILAAARYPELFQAFVGVGQVVEKNEQEEISYRYALAMAEKADDQEAIAELAGIGPPPYQNPKELSAERNWLEHFGGVYHSNPLSFNDYLKIGLSSPDYTLRDGVRFFRGQEFSEMNLWEERLHTNLFREVPTIDVPVYFFVGRFDYNTPFELVERYYGQIDAPRGKHLVWFENSGHMIPYEEADHFRAGLLQVLQETSGS